MSASYTMQTMTVLDDVGWDYLGKVLKRPFLSSESDPVPWKRLGEGLGFLSEVFTTDVPKTADRGDLEKVVLKLQLPKAEDGDTSEAASLSRFVEAMGIHIQELRFYKDVVVDTLPVSERIIIFIRAHVSAGSAPLAYGCRSRHYHHDFL